MTTFLKSYHGSRSAPAVVRSTFPTRLLTPCLACLMITGWAFAEPKSNATVELTSQDRIPHWMAEHQVPTVGVGLIEDGKLKQVKVFGELSQGVPAPVNTIFGVASLTKPVAALVVLKLVDAGKWDLDEPLSKYWTDPDIKDDPRNKKLTARLVLSHQTGLPNWRDGRMTIQFDPGTKYQYSGEGFEYLKRAIQRKFDKSFQQIAEPLVFTPLGMNDTGFHWIEAMGSSRFAIAKDKAGNALFPWVPSIASAAGSLLTTVDDYAKFGVAVIHGAGLSPKLFSEMIRPHVALPGEGGLSYGLGCVVMKDLSNGEYALLHRGGHGGVRTIVILLPQSKRGLVVLTNGENGEEVYTKIVRSSLDRGNEIIERQKKADTSELARHFDSFLEKTLREEKIPGLAVGIVEDGRLIYARGFGVMKVGDTSKPVTTETLFHMASVTKPFVATAVMQLVERGQVDLDSPITKYLPYFRLKDDRYRSITVRQMLTHMSGMPDVDDYRWDHPEYDDGALERYVRSLQDKELRWQPGSKHAYSNMAYEVLGDLVAKVSGTSFEDYVEANILKPLGMKSSTLLFKKADPAKLAAGHTRTKDGSVKPVAHHPYNRAHTPSSNLHSNVVDMARWAAANLNRGELDGHRVLKTETYDLMWKPAAAVNDQLSVGISWFLKESIPFSRSKGQTIVMHSGGDDGFKTNLVLNPARKLGVIAMTNYDHEPSKKIWEAELVKVLGWE